LVLTERRLPVSSPALDFQDRLEALTAKYTRRWEQCVHLTFPPPEPVTRQEQRVCEEQADALIQWLQTEIRHRPKSEPGRTVLKERVIARLHRFSKQGLGFPDRCLQILFSGSYRQATGEFIRRARAFDPALNLDDLFQALRNVWIANSIQLLLERPVTLTAPVFAYSMLYPCTDNLLDDPEIPLPEKQAVNDWLTARLRGLPATPVSPREAVLARLLDGLAEAYPFLDAPDVYLSLQAIHLAQIESLRLQSPARFEDGAEVLRITVRKGGTSVLADGYLVAGGLSPSQADFCFGYGVVLQLLDDLQDVSRDRAAGHRTLFTSAAARGPMDGLTERLGAFMLGFFQSAELLASSQGEPLKELMARSCGLLVQNAVAMNPDLFTREYSERQEGGSRFGFSFIRERRKTSEKTYRTIRAKLKRPDAMDSVLSALG
jgi:hypothetical protein